MKSHLKAISRPPVAAQSTIQVKTTAIIDGLTQIVLVLTEDVIPFVTNLVDVITQYTRSRPWFS